MDLYLFGGGWRPEARPFTYARFVAAARRSGAARIALIVAEEPGQDAGASFARMAEVFQGLGLGAAQLLPLYVSDRQPLSAGMLRAARPTAVFVCGGLTPLYQQALCRDLTWLAEARAAGLPYGGFSAGAAIAARQALVGGWQLDLAGQRVAVTNPDAAEDLDPLTVRPGLGLLDAAVDVHASQWGTLSRLVHAVHAGLLPSGWALDEDTLLQLEGGVATLHGLGSAYRVERGPEGVSVRVLTGQRA